MRNLLMTVFVFCSCSSWASSIERCAVFCGSDSVGHGIKIESRDYFERRGLPIQPPKIETTLNCFKPVLACIGELNKCEAQKFQVQWNPDKESRLPTKTIIMNCEQSKNLGQYLKADLGLELFYQGTGTFAVGADNKKTFYYKVVTGE